MYGDLSIHQDCDDPRKELKSYVFLHLTILILDSNDKREKAFFC